MCLTFVWLAYFFFGYRGSVLSGTTQGEDLLVCCV